VKILENNNYNGRKTITIKCPECFNFMNGIIYKNGTLTGKCAKCNSTVIENKRSNQKLIKILLAQQ